MLIEYKIKFEKDGLTIAQHIDPNSTPVIYGRIKAPVTSLPAAQHEVATLLPRNPLSRGGAPGDPFGGAPGDPFGGSPGDPIGGGPPGSAPIFILGPIVFGNSVPEHQQSTEPPKPEPQKQESQKPAPAPKALGTAAGKKG